MILLVRMKNNLFVILFLSSILFIGLSLKADKKESKGISFTVINVQGSILYLKTGNKMERGDTYVTGTNLSFQTKESRAAVANSEEGRLILTGNEKGKIRILPATNNMSSRSGALLNIIDLKNHFDGRYFIIEKHKIEIAASEFPMNEENFFYLRFNYNDEDIAKRLAFDDNKLILDKSEIFKVDGNPIPVTETEMTLYYRKNGQGEKISKFTPIFPDIKTLREEVALMLEVFSFKDEAAKYNEIKAHINEFYGKPNDKNLKTWLNQEFKDQFNFEL